MTTERLSRLFIVTLLFGTVVVCVVNGSAAWSAIFGVLFGTALERLILLPRT